MRNSLGNSLEGKVALVTGGSYGFGLTTAQNLVKAGATVFITSPRQDQLDSALITLGSKATGIRTSGRIPGELSQVYQTVKQHTGRVDMVYTMGQAQ